MKQEDHNGSLPLPEAERIAYLIAGFLQNKLTEEEHDELDAWVVASEANTRLFEELTDEENLEAGLQWQKAINEQAALTKLKEELGLRKKPFYQKIWPYLVACCLVIALITISLFRNNNEYNQPTAVNDEPSKTESKSHQAVLTLSNGRTIILDSAGAGPLATDGEVSITKGAQGEILYEGSDSMMRYNVVSTPRGGMFPLVLGDGTRVWLNAESSLKFPAGFGSGERTVTLSGEGYFEVAKNRDKPFRVTILRNGEEAGKVEVLGTQFNINGYGDDGWLKTTLKEGSVRVKLGNKSAVLEPGQEAQLGRELKVVTGDVQGALAWKDGQFLFRDATIQTIGAQLQRWYDVEVVYKGEIPYHFNATIDRNETLAEVMKTLEATKRLRLVLEEKKLILQPMAIR
jgi:transmembrane sensor